MKTLWQILAIAVVLLIAFIGGCQYRKKTFKCPVPVTNTVYIHDTVTHTITVNHYIQHTDTIINQVIIPAIVDTAFILRDYFATHVVSRKWENDTLRVNLMDYISQNNPVNNIFRYQIKTPFTTITNTVDNSVHYSKYVYISIGGVANDLKYIDFGLFYASRRTLIGIGYVPLQKTLSFKLGVPIAKFK